MAGVGIDTPRGAVGASSCLYVGLMPETGEMITIKPAVWRPGVVIVWSLVVGMFVASAVIWPGRLPGTGSQADHADQV